MGRHARLSTAVVWTSDSFGRIGISSIGARVRALASAVAVLALMGTWAPKAFSQAKYPNRPIRLLVPFAPGGGVDVVARIVGHKVSEKIGQTILVESKPGGGGAAAVGELMRAEPDGYTLLMTTSAHATLPRPEREDRPDHPGGIEAGRRRRRRGRRADAGRTGRLHLADDDERARHAPATGARRSARPSWWNRSRAAAAPPRSAS